MKKVLVLLLVFFLSVAMTASWAIAADQTRDQLRDQLQLRDGSCDQCPCLALDATCDCQQYSYQNQYKVQEQDGYLYQQQDQNAYMWQDPDESEFMYMWRFGW